MKIGVLGAGIVGCATAYALVRAGHEVTLIDRADGPALETSHANGAQLSYSYVQPFASPSTLWSLPSMLLSRTSPIRWKPSLERAAMAWQLQFLAACTHERSKQGTRELLTLAFQSRQVLHEWMQEEGWSVAHNVSGKLVLCTTEGQWREQRTQVALQASMGCQQQLLSPRECVEKEPALAAYQHHIIGGVWTGDEAVCDPHLLASAMTQSIVARGGKTIWACEVSPLDLKQQSSGRIKLETTRGSMVFDRLVLAAGPWSAEWGKACGLALPVTPIKGYSLTLDPKPGRQLPTASVTDLSRKTVFAPLGGRLRVAAMAELVGHDLSLNQRRLQQMVESVDAVFPNTFSFDTLRPWVGLRPATPDSVPLIGPSAIPGLMLNTGHGALGLTLAAGSASRLNALLNQ